MKKGTIQLILMITGIGIEILKLIKDSLKGGHTNDGKGTSKEK